MKFWNQAARITYITLLARHGDPYALRLCDAAVSLHEARQRGANPMQEEIIIDGISATLGLSAETVWQTVEQLVPRVVTTRIEDGHPVSVILSEKGQRAIAKQLSASTRRNQGARPTPFVLLQRWLRGPDRVAA